MKKNLIGLLILLMLAGAAYFVYQQRGIGTLKPAMHDFAVKDTASISRIFLADKYGRKVLLIKKNSTTWEMEDGQKVRKDLMDVLLKTIYSVDMKAPVAQSAHNNIVKLMAGKSVKVELYAGEDRVKTYYVGDATNDNMGTYMLLEGSSTPFICHIPGFIGYLTPRYAADPLVWRDTEVFANRLPQIAELVVEYNEYPNKSFKVNRSKDGKYSFATINPPQQIVHFDTVELMRYLLNYDNIRFEQAQAYPPAQTDSIVNSHWLFRIKLTEPSGNVRSVTTHRIIADPEDVDDKGIPLEWDPDQMHVILNGNTKEVVLAQYYSFDRLTVDPVRFLQPQSLKQK